MNKLNNKGVTTIEIIVCFVLIVIITASMYSTISSFNQKRTIESYKSEVSTYVNLLTKDIQDDFIEIGLIQAKYTSQISEDGYTTIDTLDCELKDGTSRKLIIIKTIAESYHHKANDITENNNDDNYEIKYGPPGAELEYPLPNLGHSKNEKGKEVKDLGIDNVSISIDDNNVLDLFIGLYHPELTNRYAVHIVCPIDYITPGADATNKLM